MATRYPGELQFSGIRTPPAAYTNLSITTLGIDGDINAAFNQWTYANQSQNTSNVGFYLNAGNGPHIVRAVQVNFPGIPFLGDPGVSAQSAMAYYTGTTVIAQTTTTFYYGSIADAGYNNIDPANVNYHAFIQKIMVHEIGHPMGLDNQPVIPLVTCGGQTAGQSVMNAQCGTNDSASNLPAPALGIPSCDNASI